MDGDRVSVRNYTVTWGAPDWAGPKQANVSTESMIHALDIVPVKDRPVIDYVSVRLWPPDQA